MTSAPTVLIVGLGYVGLPLAQAFADGGCVVLGYDTSAAKVAALSNGESYVEDVRPSEVSRLLESGSFVVTADPPLPGSWDAAIIAVPTPLDDNRLPDLGAVRSAAKLVGSSLRPGALVVLESTTYPGTTRDVLGPLLQEVSGLRAGQDFLLAFSPERVDPGNSAFSIVNTPKLVGGLDERSCRAAVALYERAVERVVPVDSLEVAELSKLLENTYRHVNIALVNELAIFAHELGIDVWDVVNAASSKPFGFAPFRPGPGVGGHCLPIDPSYLSWRVRSTLNKSFRFIELANEVNDLMPDYVVQRLLIAANGLGDPLRGKKVAVLGLSYKADVGDTRESPAWSILESLARLGAEPIVFDPHVQPRQEDSWTQRVWSSDSLADIDYGVLVTDHSQFLQQQQWLSSLKFVLDTRGRLLAAPNLERL